MNTEKQIVEQLQLICDKNGKELKPKESAKLFHKLGLIYKIEILTKNTQNVQCSNLIGKIKLIQSAALLNAAIVRDPDNVEAIKQDLKLFCFELLKVSNAANQKADLVKHSQLIAEEVAAMRYKVKATLKTIPQIPDDITDDEFNKLKSKKVKAIINLQNNISEDYKEIMKHLAGYCEEIMGTPPCRYALVGLGSLSRKEITPYSDFENIIVLKDGIDKLSEKEFQKLKEYFRWFAVIFQISLINLGETILPAVDIPILNNRDPETFNLFDAVTRRGISFDGMMPHACKSPLGRQTETEDKPFTLELIQTAGKMASSIGSDEDIKNGYHLADMLMTSCFVAGDEHIYQHFLGCVNEEIANLDMIKFEESFVEQIDKNKQDFKILTQLGSFHRKYSLNIKRMVYRSSTLFVSAIGKIHGIKESCCFDILESLVQQKLLTEKVGCDLKFAISVACEARLRVYMDRKSQDDTVQRSDIHRKFIDTVGMKSLVEYFSIIYMFQLYIYNLNIIKKPGMVLVPAICMSLQNYKYAINWANRHLYPTSSNKVDNEDLYTQDEMKIGWSYYCVGYCRYQLGQYEETMSDIQKSLDIHRITDEDPSKSSVIADHYYWIGLCKYNLGQYEEAMTDFKKSIEIERLIVDDSSKSSVISERYYRIGLCNGELGQYEEAMTNFQMSLEIHRSIVYDPSKSSDIADHHCQIGVCKYKLGQYEEAMTDIQKSLEIKRLFVDDPSKSSDIAGFHYIIGLCKYDLGQYEDAMTDFETSLEINQQIDEPYLTIYELQVLITKCEAMTYILDFVVQKPNN